MKVVIRPQPVKVVVHSPKAEVSVGSQTVKEYVDTDPYTGSYSVIPSREAQTLETSGKRMLRDVVVEPIPSCYGYIEWDGSVLTIS